MNTCARFNRMDPFWQDSLRKTIRERMVGKSNVADTMIEDSDLYDYQFKVTVMKYNSSKGWATIGYLKQNNAGDKWIVAFNPRWKKGKGSAAGKTGSYS